MSIDETNFDDELLSAYLDDELADERARVEARLAADPAARQLLDELRAVSRAMKDLPRETLPADLSESILRRAERAMLATPTSAQGEVASATGANGLVELARKLPFGRSRRAWVWAGTAIAAGLLIMVIEREPGRDADVLKEVAMGEIRRPLPPLELRAVESPPEAGSTIATDASEVPAFTAPEPGDDDQSMSEELLADSEPARPATSLESNGTLGVELQTRGAVTTDRFGGGGLGGTKPSSASVSDGVAASTLSTADDEAETVDEDSADVPASRDLLVVHVNVKPGAIEQKLIDGVFARNGILVEEAAKESDDVLANKSRSDNVSAESSATAPAAGYRFQATEGKLAKAPPKIDVVLVEAAPAQIAGCLSEIDADHSNYLGIAVDDQMTEANRSQDDKSTVNWKQHDRGFVPGQQRVQVASDNNLYMETDGRQVMLGLETAAEPANEQKAAAKPDAFGIAAPGRAVRMQQQTYGGRLGDESGEAAYFGFDSAVSPPPVDEVRRSSEIQNFDLARRSMRKIAAKANTLQVLFVLSAGDQAPQPATSPPADDAVP